LHIVSGHGISNEKLELVADLSYKLGVTASQQRHNKLCHFISGIMDYFLAGEDQQQTISPMATGRSAVNPKL